MSEHTVAPRSILVLNPDIPIASLNAGSLRLIRIIKHMVADGHRVRLMSRIGTGRPEGLQELYALGIPVEVLDPERYFEHCGQEFPGPTLAQVLRRMRPDVVWCSFFSSAEWAIPIVRRHAPGSRVVIDTVDVHSLRERRRAELTGDPADLATAQETERRERAIYPQADALVAVSDEDGAALRELAPEVPVHVLSIVQEPQPLGPGFAERRDAVFVGSYTHAPNADAAEFLAREVWPLVLRDLPGTRLHLVGSDPPRELQALADEHIRVVGWVPDTRPHLDAARVSVAALRFGAGVKGKVAEAMACGLPTVTTTVAAEGLDLTDQVDTLLADDPAAIAHAIVRLCTDERLWTTLRHNAHTHVGELLGDRVTVARLRTLLGAVSPPTRVTDVLTRGPLLHDAVVAHLRRHPDGEAAVLMVPATSHQDAQAAGDEVMRAVIAEGRDPETIPDIEVSVWPGDAPPPWAARPAEAADTDEAPPSPMLASVVICAYGKWDYTKRCLASLRATLGARIGDDIEVLVVDNASPDDTLTRLSAPEYAWVRTIALPQNLNFAGGNNVGAEAARGRVLVLLNSDTEVTPGDIETLVARADHDDVAAVGARLRYPDGTLQHGGFGFVAANGRVTPFHLFHHEAGTLEAAAADYPTTCVTGACVAVRRELFLRVGGFDETYVNGWEDVDLCLRLGLTGGRIEYAGSVGIVHHEGISGDRRYDAPGNTQRFWVYWGHWLAGDEARFLSVFGGLRSPVLHEQPPPDRAGGADLVVHGPVLGLGARGDEARALVAVLQGAAARQDAPTWITPRLTPARTAAITAALRRPAAPAARVLRLDTGDADLLRVDAPVPPRHSGVVLAECDAVAEALVAAGWDRHRVTVVPPVAVPAPGGDGGGGVLVFLPVEERAVCELVLAALPRIAGPVTVVPSVRTEQVERMVMAAVPAALLTEPEPDEAARSAMAAQADVVVALGAAHQRLALVAAGGGASVVTRPGGSAQEVLGRPGAYVDGDDPAALVRAVDAVRRDRDNRGARRDAVRGACGVDVLLRAIGDAGAAVPVPEDRPGGTPRPGLGDFAWAPALRARRRAEGAPTVSAVVNTLNEAANLDDALRSVAWVDEIVVCDMHSDDGTRAIATRHGARILDHERTSVVEPARQFAIEQATGDWILVLDADERVPEPLAEQLDLYARSGVGNALEVPFRNWLCGAWMEGTGWGGPDPHLRFFRRGAVRWGGRVHTRPEITGDLHHVEPTGHNAILHFNYDHLDQFVEKLNRYTAKEAEADADRPTRSWDEVTAAARAEIHNRWTPELDGTRSAALSMAMFFYRFMAGAKQWERHGFPDLRLPATPEEALADLAGTARQRHRDGVAAFAAGDAQGALEHLWAALEEAFPAELVSDLAVVMHAAGDIAGAERMLAACLEMAPDHDDARRNLASLRSESAADAA
ncbi:MAG: glycosyltransferase [Thermoleophilia bacterium]